MRRSRLLIPLALTVPLALASPAAAADWGVEVVDFEFQPQERQIAVGDSVTWNFAVAGHTSTSTGGQPDSWNSAPGGGTNSAGVPFTKVFNTPGRYQYICIPHQAFMKGVIQVGTDMVAKSISNFKSKRTGNRVKLSFLLKEPATVTYKLTGKSRRTVKRGRLAAGKHSFTLRRLKRGSYRGVLTVVDNFDKKVTPRNSFVIR
ncbi:MAG TPA: plastocyanin/azurin family copper-binding protein [Thermoleophilaceae bacterium]|nr:plastocyanin/azurin family copper-binding protein [Thermoleophilaceae bacterium]